MNKTNSTLKRCYIAMLAIFCIVAVVIILLFILVKKQTLNFSTLILDSFGYKEALLTAKAIEDLYIETHGIFIHDSQRTIDLRYANAFIYLMLSCIRSGVIGDTPQKIGDLSLVAKFIGSDTNVFLKFYNAYILTIHILNDGNSINSVHTLTSNNLLSIVKSIENA